MSKTFSSLCRLRTARNPWTLLAGATRSAQQSAPPPPPPPPRAVPVGETPPLPVRAGLVGATTALATPLFPVIGFNQLAFRFLDPATRMALTGGVSMLYFSAVTLTPEAMRWAPLMLPFAVGNGATAGALYLGADVAAGGPLALQATGPVVGVALGVATALLAPLTYCVTWPLCMGGDAAARVGGAGLVPYDADILTFATDMLFGEWSFIWLPCFATTGAVAGFASHFLLERAIVGARGVPWPQLAGRGLAALALGVGAMYSTSLRGGVLHLSDFEPPSDERSWLTRMVFAEWNPSPSYVAPGELGWVATVDARSGAAVSERRRVLATRGEENSFWEGRHIVVTYEAARPAGAGDGLLSGEQVLRDDGKRAAAAAALARKAEQVAARCPLYTTRRAAFFDSEPLSGRPLTKASLEHLRASLNAGEILATDALVALVAACAPRAELEASVARLARATPPSSRARGGVPSWVASSALLREIGREHAARMRELLRLEAEAANTDVAAGRLKSELASAGVCVARARTALRDLDWQPPADKASRAEDLQIISRAQTRETRWASIRKGLRTGFRVARKGLRTGLRVARKGLHGATGWPRFLDS